MSTVAPTPTLLTRLTLGVSMDGPVTLPPDPTQKIGIVGVSNSGKSYAAGVMIEQWLQAGVPLCVLDPVGIWYGLRSGADGNPEHGAPIAIIGGPHGDTGGLPPAADVAREFRQSKFSMVVDLSEQTPAEMQLWAAEFAEALMAPGPGPMRPCHIVLEEAPLFCPQAGQRSKYQQRCKSAFASLVAVGGNRGYGITVITQRAATVDKNVLNQCNSLLLMRIAADLDRRAIMDWVANNYAQINVKQVLAEMSSLPNGVGYLWAPNWADRAEFCYVKVWIAQRQTWHPKRTEFGLVKPPELLKIPGLNNWRASLRSFWTVAKPIAKALCLLALIAGGLYVLYWIAKAILGLIILSAAIGAVGAGRRRRR
jgi:hypothetical protein